MVRLTLGLPWFTYINENENRGVPTWHNCPHVDVNRFPLARPPRGVCPKCAGETRTGVSYLEH